MLKPFRLMKDHELPRHKGSKAPLKAFVSSQYLAQVFEEDDQVIRITVNSVKRKGNNWKDGITFDHLQEIKSMIGYGDKLAVEVYPEDRNMVNVANMRHLWILPDRPNFAWSK